MSVEKELAFLRELSDIEVSLRRIAVALEERNDIERGREK
jgi:hypothetical protein